MSESLSRHDIRRLLKTFGIQADEAMIAHLARNPAVLRLDVRITLEDVTDYGAAVPERPLHLVVEGSVAGANGEGQSGSS